MSGGGEAEFAVVLQVTQKSDRQGERPASYLNIAFTGFHDDKCKYECM